VQHPSPTPVVDAAPTASTSARLNEAQAAAASEFRSLLLQADAVNAYSSSEPGDERVNDQANLVTYTALLAKAANVLKSVTWPASIAADVQPWIASTRSTFTDAAALLALPSGSANAPANAGMVDKTFKDMIAFDDANERIRADFGLPPDQTDFP
jgi:hypothetical protein